MTVATLVFLTPMGAIVGLAFLVPLLAVGLRERSASQARRTIGLHPPRTINALLRPLAIAGVGALVATTAAQPALRTSSGALTRTDAELYLAFDVTRSMLAASSPTGASRLTRARSTARAVHTQLLEVPTGVATLTNRMMPLLFPTGDERGVSAVLDRAVRILQPQPATLTAPRATQLGVLTLAADRSYFNPGIRKRMLVVFSDLDTDFFSLEATLRTLRRHRIEPFVVRVARPGEQIFDRDGQPLTYRSVSTISVHELRRAGWHAYEEREAARLTEEVRAYLGDGPVTESGVIVSERSLATWCALAALMLVCGLTLPTLFTSLRGVAAPPAA